MVSFSRIPVVAILPPNQVPLGKQEILRFYFKTRDQGSTWDAGVVKTQTMGDPKLLQIKFAVND